MDFVERLELCGKGLMKRKFRSERNIKKITYVSQNPQFMKTENKIEQICYIEKFIKY